MSADELRLACDAMRRLIAEEYSGLGLTLAEVADTYGSASPEEQAALRAYDDTVVRL